VSNDAGDFGINQFLCGGGSLFGVCAIIFRDERKGHGLAINFDARFVEIGDGELRTKFIVFAKMRDGSGQGADVPDLDRGIFRGAANEANSNRSETG
jgi:hypothetical protein